MFRYCVRALNQAPALPKAVLTMQLLACVQVPNSPTHTGAL